ncbi:MAG: TetR/AcrR family transcriptional regulator [Ignavibacteriota bacterium]|nr:TetR/AcrR family transcriptional regulator [Ignavibacteriota bacterium]MBW7869285.1 TetR/AcrR family transcriptional regulator [Brumimicrobium sp.]MCO6446494.1 TetR/AcrR family transcriptional regulator [Ignavibacterium album]MCZ2267917.1 TetR/AcrR family transcriptional regulator [Ignavibacteriales bacterium]MEB2297545.1 TetR/AcrR family transcriptional regulator [Ignavibacteria bacterium]HOJ06423.1 TetR/AcrR family transcriptional regulator [Ignavibacteriaceae bacterium]
MKNKKFVNNEFVESENEIITFLNNQFIFHGFKNFSLDELALRFQISKKTIYKRFETKEEIIRTVLNQQLSEAYTNFVSIIQSRITIVEMFVELSKIIEKYYSVFNETSIKKLSKYFPELAEYIVNFRTSRIIPLVKILLKLGKKRQLILEIPDEIIIRVFNSALSDIVQSKSTIDSQQSYEGLFRQSFNLLLNGILTKKGKQILINKIEVVK